MTKRLRVSEAAGVPAVETTALRLGVGADSVVDRTNLAVNPTCSVDATGWSIIGLATGVSGARVAPGAGGPLGSKGHYRLTYSTTQADPSLNGIAVGSTTSGASAIVVSPGALSISVYARSSVANRTARIEVSFRNAAGASIGVTSAGVAASIGAGWTRLTWTGTAPANTERVQVWVPGVAGSGYVNGSTLDAGAVLVEQLATVGSYFDGDTGMAADGSYAEWTGAAGASTSIQGADANQLPLAPVATGSWTNFPPGLSAWTVFNDASYPALNGLLITHRVAGDSNAYQEFRRNDYGFDNGLAKLYTRYWNSALDEWSDWASGKIISNRASNDLYVQEVEPDAPEDGDIWISPTLIQRWNGSGWDRYDQAISADADIRLDVLESGQTQNWNFVANPSFEEWSTDSPTAGEPANWSKFWTGGAAAAQSYGKTTTARTGRFAWQVSFTAAALNGDFRRLQSQGMPCTAGQWWEASVWVQASVANRAYVTLTGQFGIDANTNYFDPNTVSTDFAQTAVANTTGWVLLKGRLQVPAGKTVMRVVVSVAQNVAAGTANQVITDDVALRLLDVLSPVTTVELADDAVTTAKIADGTITLDDLSATGAKSAATFLRGDNTWAAPAGGGGSGGEGIRYGATGALTAIAVNAAQTVPLTWSPALPSTNFNVIFNMNSVDCVATVTSRTVNGCSVTVRNKDGAGNARDPGFVWEVVHDTAGGGPGSMLTYTPAFSAITTLGNGTVSGRYLQLGPMVWFSASMVVGSTTVLSAAVWTVSLPVTPRTARALLNGSLRTSGTYPLFGEVSGAALALRSLPASGSAYIAAQNGTPVTLAAGNVVYIDGWYEAA